MVIILWAVKHSIVVHGPPCARMCEMWDGDTLARPSFDFMWNNTTTEEDDVTWMETDAETEVRKETVSSLVISSSTHQGV
jgi:hypothetical protein